MENTEKEKFEAFWNDFATLVRGKLIATAKKQSLSTPLARLVLSDAVGSWEEEYSLYGRWLQQLSQNDTEKANLIKEILLKDMTFADVDTKKVLPDYCNYLIPGLGACAGYALGRCFDFGKIGQIASVIIPAILLYPAVKMFRNNQAEVAIEKTVNAYMEQLEKYKNSVLSVLS